MSDGLIIGYNGNSVQNNSDLITPYSHLMNFQLIKRMMFKVSWSKTSQILNDPSWMHVQMSTDGRLHQQAVQGNITQMLGYLYFKNNRTNASDNTR